MGHKIGHKIFASAGGYQSDASIPGALEFDAASDFAAERGMRGCWPSHDRAG